MYDYNKIKEGLERCSHATCPSIFSKEYRECKYTMGLYCRQDRLLDDALGLIIEQNKKIEALRLLVEWATECDFGYDQFLDEYNKYKNEIKDMGYIDGMIHIAERTLEDAE